MHTFFRQHVMKLLVNGGLKTKQCIIICVTIRKSGMWFYNFVPLIKIFHNPCS